MWHISHLYRYALYDLNFIRFKYVHIVLLVFQFKKKINKNMNFHYEK